MKPLDVVYWDPTGAIVGLVLLSVVAAGIIARWRWNLSGPPGDVFVVDRSAAIEKLRAGLGNGLRAHLRWRKPEWDDSGWIGVDIAVSDSDLIIVPRVIAGFGWAFPGFKACVVPRSRITKIGWVVNEMWPAWRSGVGSQLLAISTDADATCYVGSWRAETLESISESLSV
jgi:hypothetical protein